MVEQRKATLIESMGLGGMSAVFAVNFTHPIVSTVLCIRDLQMSQIVYVRHPTKDTLCLFGRVLVSEVAVADAKPSSLTLILLLYYVCRKPSRRACKSRGWALLRPSLRFSRAKASRRFGRVFHLPTVASSPTVSPASSSRS
jgi:hypothetical protein